MSRISLFNSPLFLGFDHFERLIDNLSKCQDESYPPYNIEQIGENGFRITLALAGFKRKNIQILMQDNQLTIKGKQEDSEQRAFLHKGIATRQFIRTFILSDAVEVDGAEFEDGLLHINLIRIKPINNVREIKINGCEDDENVNFVKNITD